MSIEIEIEDRNAVTDGEAVQIEFIPALSGYAEPQGYAFLPGTNTQLRFRGNSRPLEAYGYTPKEPSATPVPFWGDAYIKKDRRTGQAPTLWHQVKRVVNQEVFFRKSIGRRVDAEIKQTRTRGIAKFLCPAYHRHLNQAYEALWALTEAIRERAAEKDVLAARLPLDDAACAAIGKRAAKLSDIVAEKKNECYRSSRLIHLVRTLEVRGYAPQHRLVPQDVRDLLADMFEMICSDYLRSEAGYPEIQSGFDGEIIREPGQSAEVDVYARNSSGRTIKTLVCSCKVRYAPVPKSISRGEMNRLIQVVNKTKQEESALAAKFKKHAEVKGVFFSNTELIDPEAKQLALENGIAVLCAELGKAWAQKPARVRLADGLRQVGGVDISAFLPLPPY